MHMHLFKLYIIQNVGVVNRLPAKRLQTKTSVGVCGGGILITKKAKTKKNFTQEEKRRKNQSANTYLSNK